MKATQLLPAFVALHQREAVCNQARCRKVEMTAEMTAAMKVAIAKTKMAARTLMETRTVMVAS